MKAIGVVQGRPTSDPDCFVAFDAPTPSPGPRDLLVQVKAVSVNPEMPLFEYNSHSNDEK